MKKSNLFLFSILQLFKASYYCWESRIKNPIRSKNFYVLIPSVLPINHTLIQLPLILSAYRSGLRIKIYLTLREPQSLIYYFFLGVTSFYFINNPFEKTSSDYKNKNFKELELNKYYEASFKRVFKLDSLNNSNKDHLNFMSKTEKSNIRILKALTKLNFKKIRSIFFTDTVYVPQGPIYEYIKKYQPKIYTLTYNVGHLDNTLVINELTKSDQYRHPYIPEKNKFMEFKKENKKYISEIHKNIIRKLENFYIDKHWFPICGTSDYCEDQNIALENKINKIRESNQIITIFPHIYWDAAGFYGKSVFPNFKIWLEESIVLILKNTKEKIIVKDHPANLSKLNLKSNSFESSVERFISQLNNEDRERIIYLPPNTNFSTIKLLKLSDLVLTVRGTVAAEAALYRKKVILGGTGKYDYIEIASSSTQKNDYIFKLKKALKSSQLETTVHFNAALYLKCLWEEMTYYTKIINFKFIKVENHHQPKTIFQQKFINSKEIDKLSKWLLKPNVTFNNN